MIDVACNCGAKFRVAPAHAGKEGKCPKCNSVLAVPKATVSSHASTNRPEERRAEKPPAKNVCAQCGAPVPELTYSCPYCGGSVIKPRQETASNLDAAIGESGSLSKPESAVGSIMNALDGGIGNLRREAANVPNSPEELVTFFSRHIGGVGEMHYGPIHRQACQAALTKLHVFAANDSKLANVVSALETQLNSAPKAKSPMVMAGIIGGVSFAVLVLLLILSLFMLSREGDTRAEINLLIREGRYTEARMLAEDISGLKQRESIIETVDNAEDRDKR